MPVEIIKLETVALTREKQDILLPELDSYARSTNFAIKTILKKHLTSPKSALDTLYPIFVDRFLQEYGTEEDLQLRIDSFAKQFDYSLVTHYVPKPHKSPNSVRKTFASLYLKSYLRDVIKTAGSEISKHRKMARVVRTMRSQQPHFKRGRIIVSGMLVQVDEKGIQLLTSTGNQLPIPFDKWSRNQAEDSLKEIKDPPKENSRAYDRVRITWNEEGYASIDIRISS